MLLEVARDRRILFIGGKGGTGKTSTASALALARAREGARVLLASTDPAHSLGHIWDQDLGDEPTPVATFDTGQVRAVEIDPQRTVDRHFARVEATMLRMLPERQHAAARRHLELAKSAPGSFESAILERIAELAGGSDAAAREDTDLLIFDTAPTGHTLHLLALPQRLTSWTESLLANRDRSERFAAAARGLTSSKEQPSSADAQLRRTLLARRDRFARLREAILDPGATGFVVVALAEKLPAAESLELAGQLEQLGIGISAFVVNRRSPADHGDFLAQRRAQEEPYVQQLRRRAEQLGAVPLLQVPLLPGNVSGPDGLAALADQLSS